MDEDLQKLLKIAGMTVGGALFGFLGLALIDELTKDLDAEESKTQNRTMVSEKEQKNNVFDQKGFLNILNDMVIGQSQAKKEVTKTIHKNLLKQQILQDIPILGTFFFVGPTGVGKTEMSKAIAKYFEKSGYQYLRFDMGGFSDYHTASTLVGSPKGYVGSDEGGALTRPLMKNPKAVILFDEMEKAHSSLYKTFMSLIDEGEIQEVSTGNRIKLSQAIIIFTSNLYQDILGKVCNLIEDEVDREIVIRDILTGKFDRVLKYISESELDSMLKYYRSSGDYIADKFPPEFVGRIDKFVYFSHLTYNDYVTIVKHIARKYRKNVDPRLIVDKYIEIAKNYGVRQFIKKVEEDLLLGY